MARTKVNRRVVRTKDAIQKAFQELYIQKDFKRITIHDIARPANVNRATVYLHYLDKYDLFHQCVEDLIDNMFLSCPFSQTAVVKITNEDDAIEALRSLFLYMKKHAPFFSSALSDQNVYFRSRLHDMCMRTMQTQISMQGINEAVDEELMIQYLASAFVGTVEWWIRNEMEPAPAFMAQQVYQLLARNQVFAPDKHHDVK